jgi:hypothetical protein
MHFSNLKNCAGCYINKDRFGRVMVTQKKDFFPLRAKQVSEANLRSEQGGINFTPFVLSLPNSKKKKKKKKNLNFPYG